MTKLRSIAILLVCMLMIAGSASTASANMPTIIDCSSGTIYARPGDTVTLFVEADSNGNFFEWKALSDHTPPENESRYTSTYTFTMTKELHNFYLWCKVSYDQSYYTYYEYSSMVCVKLPDLEIQKQPEGNELVAGMEASTSISAIGENVRYRWYSSYEKGAPKLLSFVTPDISMTLTEPGEYRIFCEVTDRFERSVTSDNAIFIVHAPVHIKRDIENVKARTGSSVDFDFLAEGYRVTYQWYYKNPKSQSFSALEGATSPNLSFTMDSSTNGRQLYCIATDAAGHTVRSATVTATLDTSLSIVGDCTICGGDGACNRCGGTGWYYQFQLNGTEHSNKLVRCDSGLCLSGICMGCGGDGWLGSVGKLTPGDANQDGKVNTADALLVMQYDAGWNVSPNKQASDVNTDGNVNTFDAVRILQNIASN